MEATGIVHPRQASCVQSACELQGLAPLQWHDGIARIAREHAEQMASGAAPFSTTSYLIQLSFDSDLDRD